MSNLDIQKALVNVMVTMSAVDQTMSDHELTRIGSLIRNMPVFEGYDIENLIDDAKRCSEILASEDGLDRVLADCATTVPEHLHETAYALAVDVAAADLSVEQEEIRFLAMLRDELNIDRLICVAIERGARARHEKL